MRAEAVVNRLRMLEAATELAWGDNGDPLSANAQSRAMEDRWMAWGHPYNRCGGACASTTAEIKDMLATCAAVNRPKRQPAAAC